VGDQAARVAVVVVVVAVAVHASQASSTVRPPAPTRECGGAERRHFDAGTL
jgi:hypothetical protein